MPSLDGAGRGDGDAGAAALKGGAMALAPDAASAERSDAGAPPWASPKVAWFTLTMIGLVTMFGQMDRAIFYLLVQSIKRDLVITDTEISLLMGMAYSAAYLLVGLPVARWTDVGKRKFILPAALAAWSAGTAICALSSNFIQLFVARSIVGGGESVKGPSSVSMISDLFPREKLPRAFAGYNFAIRFGEALALILGGLLIGYFASLGTIHFPVLGDLKEWHLVFLIFGLPGVLFALVFMLTVPEPARHGRRYKGSMPIGESLKVVCRGTSGRVLIPILLAAAGTGDFTRVRVGVGRPAGSKAAADHVLGGFSSAERSDLPSLVVDAADAVEQITTDGLLAAQQRWHSPASS